ncbi:hypothetical protein AVEN_39383-1 [Araneus ventricosus]|uniref:Uncharacterized protein n=1 Tax=Araneus ventricosus TaxID=182803 RepID=A0A4Y2CVY6_ARAVE|nr:hypothetical protein AVEN_39383-1 [Araneus ventricosus]
MTRKVLEPVPPLQTSAPHQGKAVCPPKWDLACHTPTYAAYLQRNPVSSLESIGPEAGTLPLGHRGPFIFQLRKCTDLHDLEIVKQRINQVLFDLEMSRLKMQRNHLPSQSLNSSMPDTIAITFSEASFSNNYRYSEDSKSRVVTNEDNDYTIL